jgi:hypothetical protein
VIEQLLDVDILETEALDRVESTSPLSAGIIRSDNGVLDRFAGGVCAPSAPTLRISSPRKRCTTRSAA